MALQSSAPCCGPTDAVPKDLYTFPDFPYPPELLPEETFPNGAQVRLANRQDRTSVTRIPFHNVTLWSHIQKVPTPHSQVHAYVKAYAQHFELLPHIKLRCRLIQLRPRKAAEDVEFWGRGDAVGRGWTVVFQDLAAGKYFKVNFKGRGGKSNP